MGPENWLVGCVQLWFSIAITKTVLIGGPSSARAFSWIERASRANRPSVPKRVTCDINYLPVELLANVSCQRDWESVRKLGLSFCNRFVKIQCNPQMPLTLFQVSRNAPHCIATRM